MEIYYFSGTGNSLFVAKQIQKSIHGSKLISINKFIEDKEISTTAQEVGIVFPVYGFSLPPIVESFLKKINIDKTNYLFVIATRGGSPSNVPEDISRIFTKKRKRLNSFFYLNMPNNSFFIHDLNTQEQADKKLENIKAEIPGIIDLIRKHEDNQIIDTEINLFNGIMFRALHAFLNLTGYLWTGNAFYVNSKCTQCRICETVCLSKRITVQDGEPHFNKKIECRLCVACVNYCPANAIRNKALRKSKTMLSGQYHNPEITANEIGDQRK